MSAETPRTKLAIMTELYKLTKMMVANQKDADFLILSVEKRQDLMDECDAFDLYHPDAATQTEADQLEFKRMLQEIIKFDATITEALKKHRTESKASLVTSTAQQKVLGYTNQAMSSSGSYMDYKK